MKTENEGNLMHGIKAVVFDFDGTLAVLNIDFGLMREQVFRLMKQFDIREERIVEKYVLEIIDEAYLILRERNPFQAEAFHQKAHQILFEIEFEAAKAGKLYPGVKRALRKLRENRIKVGIVTRNCEGAVRRVFPDINEHCDIFVSRDSVKKVKPHPAHLNAVTERLKVQGEEVIMVGDHVIDIQAGQRAGTKTIGVLTGRIKKEEFERAGADYILESAAEICSLLPSDL